MKIAEIIFILSFGAASLTMSSYAQNRRHNALSNFLKTPGIQASSASICVKDFSGKNIVEHNINMPLSPASTLKIITTATSLEILGSDFRYNTFIGVGSDDGTLVIKGKGDPTLGTIYNEQGTKRPASEQNLFLTEWITAIKKKFLSTVHPLKIIIDDSYFGYQGISRDWIYEDIGNYYAGGVYGINLFDNFFQLALNTENVNQSPKILYIKPKIKGLAFTNLLDYNSTDQDNAFITSFPMSNEFTLIGNVP